MRRGNEKVQIGNAFCRSASDGRRPRFLRHVFRGTGGAPCVRRDRGQRAGGRGAVFRSFARGAGQELADGYGAVFEGIDILKSGFETFDRDGIRELTDIGGEDLLNVLSGLRAVKAADGIRESFSGAAPGTETETGYVIETAEIG